MQPARVMNKSKYSDSIILYFSEHVLLHLWMFPSLESGPDP